MNSSQAAPCVHDGAFYRMDGFLVSVVVVAVVADAAVVVEGQEVEVGLKEAAELRLLTNEN